LFAEIWQSGEIGKYVILCNEYCENRWFQVSIPALLKRVASMTCCLLVANSAISQSSELIAYYQPVDVTGLIQNLETQPVDDEVLGSSPTRLSLQFPQDVRLVKLTLRNQLRDWIDISFRYNPRARHNYEWQLPVLPAATYYTADWAILLANDQLVRGSFSFAFGKEAEPPSVVRAAEALLLEARNTSAEGGQYIGSPPTRIIINQDPPEYDPPFTIELKDQN